MSNGWLVFPRGYTMTDELAVNLLPANSRVVVRCKAKRKRQQRKACPKSKTYKVAAARSRLGILKPFRKKKLPVGTKLSITITAPGWVGKRFTYTVRRTKKPKLKLQCIPPGGKPGRCT